MQIKYSRIIQLHAAFQVLGFVAQAHYVAKFLRKLWESNHHIYGLVGWASKPAPPKIEIMLEYGVLLTIATATIWALFTYAQRNDEHIELSPSRWAMLGAYELVCLLVSFSVIWIFLCALLPAWVYARNLPPRSVVAERVSLTLSFGTIVGVLLVLSVTSWKPDVFIFNDYSDLPEYTRMEDGRLIENSEFKRKHLIGPLYESDPCEDQQTSKTSVCLHLSNSVFHNKDEPFILFPLDMGVFYDWEKENLVIKKNLTAKQYLLIESIWGVKLNSSDWVVQWENSAEDDEFIRKNQRSITPPPFMGGGLDNHSGLYLQVLAGGHGVVSQYGAGLTKTLGKILSLTGAATYNHYFTIYCWAVYAYLLLLTLTVWQITRNSWVAVIALVSATIVEMYVGHDLIRSKPEYNPILHFPDLICLMAIAHDFRRGTINSASLRALAIGLMIWWNREFGLSLLAASISWHLFEASSVNGNWRVMLSKLGAECLMAGIVLFGLINMVSVSNQLDTLSFGIDSHLENWPQVIFLISLLGVLIWIRFMNGCPISQSMPYILDIAGVATIYAVLVTVFVLPNNGRTFLMLFTVTPSTIFLAWILNKKINDQVVAPRLISYIAYILIIISGGILVKSYSSYRQFIHDNENHRSFAWSLPGLSGSSTIDPEVMQKSVNLIEKYQPEGRLQIISKYDNWLRILTGRPEYFTDIDWRTAVASYETVNNTASIINQSNIPIIFVERKLLGGVVWNVHSDTMNSMSAMSDMAGISAMSQVLHKISQCYTPGENGGLLQVWHRSCEMK